MSEQVFHRSHLLGDAIAAFVPVLAVGALEGSGMVANLAAPPKRPILG